MRLAILIPITLLRVALVLATALPGNHPYIAPGPNDHRSSCPGLNTLANHGYIPRDGKNIRPQQLLDAGSAVYNIDPAFGINIINAAISCCSKSASALSSLRDLSIADRIEHDASLVHDDVPEGGTHGFACANSALITEFIAGRARLTLADFAAWRKHREALSPPLPPPAIQNSLTEVALTALIIGDGESVSTAALRTFYGEERLPDQFLPPKKQVTGADLTAVAQKVGALMRG